CWGADKKCNIKFRNHTGRASGSGGSEYNQLSRVKTVKIWAEKADGTKAGSNTLSIAADASNTMNLDKKQGFDKIKIKATPNDSGDMVVTMSCNDIKSTLKGTGNCKVFMHGKKFTNSDDSKEYAYYTSYSCDGGSVKGSSID
ncbi:MAG: hypothetical protein GY927_23320, partial [bacterium]|nr:hypothetical protein [bacterium]